MAATRTTAQTPTGGNPIVSPNPQLLARIRSEYHEMPGLRLTLVQARRLWCLDILTCAAALAALQATGFLRATRDGAFVLADAERMTA
jgi:hypothetical protein